jgi:nucleoid DNA-binding protein
MSKQNVIKRVQDSIGADNVTQQQIGAVFGAVFDVLGDLNEEQSCRVRDFGIFKVKLRKAREGSSIAAKGQKAKKIPIPARLAMTFKISKNFKEALPAVEGATTAKKKAPAKKAPAKKKAAAKKKK